MPTHLNQPEIDVRRSLAVLEAQEIADALLSEPEREVSTPPMLALDTLRERGLLAAALPWDAGGLGLGSERGGHLPLLRILASLGGADLALGRIYEGHVNALLLIETYGTLPQKRRAADDAHAGLLFGVWNTGEPAPMRIVDQHGRLTLQGSKTFATGAAFVQRPILTAEHHGWQMVQPRMECPEIASEIRMDRDSWRPLGMESSESLAIDFTGAQISMDDLIGEPGDFYREPYFHGGSIRFAAVQAGAVLRLAEMFADWVTGRGRQADPYQLARMGEIDLLAQQAVLWIERAAAVAEACLWADADEAAVQQMVRCGNMTRLAIARAATAVMAQIVPGVGAHGLMRPARFERVLRDLTMYLRQPNPDGTLAEVGRSSLLSGRLNYWEPAIDPA